MFDVPATHRRVWDFRQAVDEGYPALAELRDAGVVRGIGVGMSNVRMLTDFVRHTDLDLVMVGARYTLLDRVSLFAAPIPDELWAELDQYG